MEKHRHFLIIYGVSPSYTCLKFPYTGIHYPSVQRNFLVGFSKQYSSRLNNELTTHVTSSEIIMKNTPKTTQITHQNRSYK